MNVEETTIARLHAAYLAGTTTARAITRAYLDRIDAYDRRGPFLNSLITLNSRALGRADSLDAVAHHSQVTPGLAPGQFQELLSRISSYRVLRPDVVGYPAPV